MQFNKFLYSIMICVILLTSYNFVLAEEPDEKENNTKTIKSTEKTPDTSANKKITVNGVNIVFTGNNEALIEINGQMVKIDTATQSAVGMSDDLTKSIVENAIPMASTPSENTANENTTATNEAQDSEQVENIEPNPEDQYAYELVNVPTPKRYEKGAFSVHFTHRFSQSPFLKSFSDLFGFDSFSLSGFGFNYGITNRIYAKVYRTPLFRTIEMGGGMHLAQQSKKVPVSAMIYASVEGRDNFDEHFTTNISGMFGRSFSRYGGVFFAPTVSFNNNPVPGSNPGNTNTTGSFGFGGQINFRPTGSFVMEFVPRVGYKSPGSVSSIAFGLQKRTYRHTFTLTISNSQATTTSQYNAGFGSITDRKEFARGLVVGFNIYRRFF